MFTILNINFHCFHLKDEDSRLKLSGEKKSSVEAIYTLKSFDIVHSVQFTSVYYRVAFLFQLLPCFTAQNRSACPPHERSQICV